MNTLPAREAYGRWAASYDAETAVSALENGVVAALGVETAGRRLLDVGCGTGRRLAGARASLAIGVDLTVEMLERAARWGQSPDSDPRPPAPRGQSRDSDPTEMLGAADARALPFAAESFDVVWCRLVIGHLAEIESLFAELARVCVAGGHVVVTDLAAEAARAGHRRTFRDANGVTREVEHFIHEADAQIELARGAGLELATRRTGVVGPEIRSFYEEAGKLGAYDQQRGLPLVSALSFRKRA